MSSALPDAIATAAAIRCGETSAREVVEESIRRIEKLDPQLNAMVGTRYDEALAEVDAGLPDGPLTGVPVVIKSLAADVAGLPTTGGSRLFADDVKAEDSELVRRYKAAGMVVLGTTNTPELGKNGSTEPVLHGACHNPWSLDHSTGGSSGGSAAAVAAGLVPVAHGNDGGGSIRIPAAACGLFGLKPSRGLIPGAPYPSTLAGPTSVHGALTTTVRDTALLLDVSAGRVPGQASYGPTAPAGGYLACVDREPGRLRVGLATVVPDGPETDPAGVAAVRRTADLLAVLGHEVVEVTLPVAYPEFARWSGLMMGANLVAHVDDRLAALGRDLRDDDIEPFTRVMYERYSAMPLADLLRALEGFEQVGFATARLFADVDVVLTPTLCMRTPRLGVLDTTKPEVMYTVAPAMAGFTSLVNTTGGAAMSVPAGLDPDGLPLGAHFFTDLGGEPLLLSLAGQLERAAPWPRHAPLAG
ncbi:amidase [Nocardioides kongjuensis]|uniref:Amidase n=1 Tax=Nocardioides kongjuensis TaxID=349522 RepID=A0A852RDF7_9ACTN|nr:amidase family protein [Nocardioides kongjuensis]NYD28798.1 amidase [Nocardioides kongjuensis]